MEWYFSKNIRSEETYSTDNQFNAVSQFDKWFFSCTNGKSSEFSLILQMFFTFNLNHRLKH